MHNIYQFSIGFKCQNYGAQGLLCIDQEGESQIIRDIYKQTFARYVVGNALSKVKEVFLFLIQI